MGPERVSFKEAEAYAKKVTRLYDALPRQLRDYVKDCPFGVSLPMLRQMHAELNAGRSVEGLLAGLRLTESEIRAKVQGQFTYDMCEARDREARRLRQRNERLYGGRGGGRSERSVRTTVL